MDVPTLLEIAGPALGGPDLDVPPGTPPDLRDLFRQRNGFLAFESALRFLPMTAASGGVRARTSMSVWTTYEAVPSDAVLFAEDAFANPFFVSDDAYRFLDLETGEAQFVGSSLDGFVQALLARWNYFSGFATAHAWQLANGALAPAERLIPTVPFVLGGQFEETNLRAVDADEAIRLRTGLHAQLRGRPDGMKVRFDPATYTID